MKRTGIPVAVALALLTSREYFIRDHDPAPELKMGRCRLCGTETHGHLFCSAAHSNMWHGQRRSRRKS